MKNQKWVVHFKQINNHKPIVMCSGCVEIRMNTKFEDFKTHKG